MKAELKIPMHNLPQGAWEIMRLWLTSDDDVLAVFKIFPQEQYDRDPERWSMIFARMVISLSQQIASKIVGMADGSQPPSAHAVCDRIMGRFVELLHDETMWQSESSEGPLQ